MRLSSETSNPGKLDSLITQARSEPHRQAGTIDHELKLRVTDMPREILFMLDLVTQGCHWQQKAKEGAT